MTVHAIPIDHEYGKLEAEFRWSPTFLYWVFLAIGPVALLGSVALFIRFGLELPVFVLGGTGVFVLGAALLYDRFKRKQELYFRVYENGLVYRNPYKLVSYTWEQIERLQYEGVGDYWILTFHLVGGAEFAISNRNFDLSVVIPISFHTMRKVGKKHVQEFLSRIKEGKAVYLGPFELTHNGLRWESQFLPWSEIIGFMPSYAGNVVIQTTAKSISTGCSVMATDDLDKMLALAEVLRSET